MFLRSPFNDGGLISNTSLYYEAEVNNIPDYHINVGAAPAAIQYVGGVTIAQLGVTTDVTISLTSLTGGIGTAPRYGDLIIVSLGIGSTNDRGYRIAGFTQIRDLFASDTIDSNLQVGYKLTSPIPETSVVITGGSGSTNDGLTVVVQVYRNVNQTTPFDVTSTAVTVLNGAIPDPPAITPITTGALIVVTAVAGHNATGGGAFTASYLSNFITNNTVALGSLNDATIGMGNVAWTSGAYDPAAWTFTGTGGLSTDWSYNAVTMAIRPGPTLELLNLKSSGVWNLSAGIALKTLDVRGQQEYTTTVGSPFSFVVPANVRQISALAIGGGGGGGGWGNATNEESGGGGGGALAYNTFAVTPGETLTITVGSGGNGGQGGNGDNGGNGGLSRVRRQTTDLVSAGGGQGGTGGDGNGAGGPGGTVIAGTGFPGGAGGSNTAGTGGPAVGGGGAGGYTGAGGAGGSSDSRSGTASTGGGGGGGAALQGQTGEPAATITGGQGGGGGVGIYGPTTSGAGGVPSSLFATVNTTNSATYTNRTTTNVTGTGTGATFNVTQNAANNGYTVTLVSGGSGYSSLAGSNTIRILGTNVGGATTANDITITITAVNAGAITTFTIPGAGNTGNASAGNAIATITSTRGVSTNGTGGPYTITNSSSGVIVSNVSGGTAPSGTWSLTVTRSAGLYTISITSGGAGFAPTDTIFIPYTLIGGAPQSGGGGSGGATGTSTGGLYGGGGRGAIAVDQNGAAGAAGAVRLVWGKDYTFPNAAPAGIVAFSSQGGITYIPTIS